MNRLLLCAATSILASGCEFSAPGPPTRFSTTRVAGRILGGGKPVEAGWVALLPVDGTVGDHIVVRLHPDGTFQTDQAPVGKLQVRIELPVPAARRLAAPSPPLQARLGLLRGPSSPLRWTTAREGNLPFEFDLVFSPIPAEGS